MSNEFPVEWINFPLKPCRLVQLNQYYYAIGNSRAENIFFRDVSKGLEHVKPVAPKSWRYHSFDPVFEEAIAEESEQKKSFRILCLACGDLRNVLFSPSSNAPGSVDLVINDYDVHVLARDILILDMIFDNDDQKEGSFEEAIFSIWFSTGLEEEHFRLLERRLEKLIHQTENMEPRTSWTWRCYEVGLLNALRGVWKKWLRFFPCSDQRAIQATWDRTQEMRHKTFLINYARLDGGINNEDLAPTNIKELLQSKLKKVPATPDETVHYTDQP